MKVIRNKIIPFGSYYAINLCGLVLSKRRLTQVERNHEYIHSLQQREMLWIGFFLFYIAEWLVRLVQHRNAKRAYLAISFEREAYHHQQDLSYRYHRQLYAWHNFLRRQAYRQDQRQN